MARSSVNNQYDLRWNYGTVAGFLNDLVFIDVEECSEIVHETVPDALSSMHDDRERTLIFKCRSRWAGLKLYTVVVGEVVGKQRMLVS